MTNEEAIIVLGNLPVYPDDSYCVTEYQEAKTMAIEALEQEPSQDCISRQEALNIVHKYFEHYLQLNDDICLDGLRSLPSVTPKEKTGHWILADEQNKEDVVNDNFRFICSECLCSDIHTKNTIVPYCWKCGAKMEEVR